ncbi:MAG: type II toxin-antitoxin system RelE/ParE family toxin [Candidatus Sumerlaeota bacterium]|nr:type II toxin-antitoxin system RelE/ParE family toxin [Candidatus Sumerlaeota bacterium]
MKVHWTDNAIVHLLDIYEYIAHDSPIYAKLIIDRIIKRSEQIADFPMSGRKVPEYEADDMREMIEKPYRVIYKIKSDQIDVLAVVHCVQLLSEEI